MTLYSPHDHDFTYKRSDGTVFITEFRKDKDNNSYTPDYQLELPL